MGRKFGYRFESLLSILDTLEGIASQLRTMVEFATRLKELEQAVQTQNSMHRKCGDIINVPQCKRAGVSACVHD